MPKPEQATPCPGADAPPAVPIGLSEQLKARALELGFELAGVAPAVTPHGVTHLRDWLARGFSGEMSYMQKHSAAREHPRHILPGVRSVVVVAMNYRTVEAAPPGPVEGRISKYAWGEDYHRIMRERLDRLGEWLRAQVPGCRTRAAVDTAPLLERDFAVLAGLGWIGKNTMLIHKRKGSWLFLGALLCNIELEFDRPHHADHCGTCTRCLDACPTGAFAGPWQLDSRRCISYLTIELRTTIPDTLRPAMGEWLFGCDVCQDVCPWNRKAPIAREAGFEPRTPHGNLDLVALLCMSDAELRQHIAGTTLTRARLSGLRRNAAIVLGNRATAAALPALQHAAQDSDAMVREAAEWAVRKINARTTNAVSAEAQNSP